MAFYDVSVAADHTGRRRFTYESPDDLFVGDVIVVPFARKKFTGVVRSIVKKPTFKTKKVIQKTSYTLPKQSLELLNWLEKFYTYDYGEITRLFIPPNLMVKSRNTNAVEQKVNQDPMPQKNAEQKSALKIIMSSQNCLLHGVTGSGKTRVFLEAANKILEQGKSVLILTPEIGLTPQMIQSVAKHCPYPLKVIHSGKTPAQKKAVWDYVDKNKEPFIIVSPRSGLFLPYQNLGLIIMDESHDQSYKNMSSPRYNGLYVAAKLAAIHSAKFIQSTATPNVSEYIIYSDKKLPIITLTKPAAGKTDASGEVVDLNDKDNFTKSSQLSNTLIDTINESLKNGNQSLVFLNKRGSARVIQCQACGHTEECPRCGLPITFHHDKYKLVCHICNYQTKASSSCSNCGSADLIYQSPGTKGIEQEFKSLFPNAKIARFDLDNSAKDKLKNRYDEILAGDIDIILGTQIVSKGLDLPKLSVVGVLNADSSLQLPDYKAEESAFQQLYQVTGRVGRGHVKGKYIIQSRSPEHPIIQAALKRDYKSFIEYESHKRKQFGYPPYANLALIKISMAKDVNAKNKAEAMAKTLANNKRLKVLGPSPSYHHKQGGKYTWQIVIKSPRRQHIIDALKDIPSDWSLDMDPINLL